MGYWLKSVGRIGLRAQNVLRGTLGVFAISPQVLHAQCENNAHDETQDVQMRYRDVDEPEEILGRLRAAHLWVKK